MISTAQRIQHIEEYYFSKKLAEVKKLDNPNRPIINLGIGSPDMAPPTTATQSIIATSQNENSHGYQSYRGIPELRSAIQRFYAHKYTTTLDSENEILPLMGSKEGIMHITLAFVNEGDEVLIPDPGYPTYGSVSRMAGAKVRTYPMHASGNYCIDLESLHQQDLSRVKIMWINFPHMPTGRTATRDELKALVDLARKHHFLLVNDNPYSLILNDAPLSILSIPGASDVAIELNSLSKSHNMAGWRIGWVAGNKTWLQAILKVKSNIDSGMFLGIQTAAIEALNMCDSWFDALNQTYHKRRLKAYTLVKALGCTYFPNQAGMFVWAQVPDTILDVAQWIDEILNQTGVFITPGTVFGPSGNRNIRISLCAPEQKMDEAIHRIQSILNHPKTLQQNHHKP